MWSTISPQKVEGKDGFAEFAMEVDPATDLSMVTRPRSLPLLSEYKKKDGQTVHLWSRSNRF
jgi:sucrose phosphorylase